MNKIWLLLIVILITIVVVSARRTSKQDKTIAGLNSEIGKLQAEKDQLARLVVPQAELIESIKADAKSQSEAISNAAVIAATHRVKGELHAQAILDKPVSDDAEEFIAWAVAEAQVVVNRLAPN